MARAMARVLSAPELRSKKRKTPRPGMFVQTEKKDAQMSVKDTMFFVSRAIVHYYL